MHAMAHQGPEAAPVAGNWWEMIHANPFSSWSTVTRWPPPPNRHANLSSSYDEADMSISNTTSFTNANSGHSALSMDSSSAELSGSEPVENHIWSQVLLNVGADGEVRNGHEDGENSLEVLSSKRLTTQVFEPACDYLKKMANCWELNPSSLNCLEKHLSSYNGSIMEPGGPTNNLSHLVSNWSIAPPNSQLDHHIAPSTCNVSVGPSMGTNISHVKQEIPISQLYASNLMVGESSTSCFPSYDHGMKGESQCQDTGAAAPFLLRPHNPSSIRYQIGLNESTVGLDDNFCNGMTEINPWTNRRNLSDQISFGGCLNKRSAPMELRALKPSAKGSDLCDGNKKGYDRSSSMIGNGRVSGTTEGKKKRSEDSSETLLKKSKHDSSMVSSHKMQVPKVKIAEKISALQQLVSPFGKTDQASVLMETITYIRILQEQVQLLSDPYLKSSATKEHNSWGELERQEKSEAKHDLRNKGLCLVPVTSIPQVHRETNRPDYWMPTYRSCLYR